MPLDRSIHEGDQRKRADETLLQQIQDLRAAEQASFGSRHHRTDFYNYLAKVYAVYVDWKERKISKRKSRRVAELLEIKTRKNTHPIRVLIDASSSGQDIPVKSRWTQALRFAVLRDVRPCDLPGFLKKHDGATGCASKMADCLR